MELVCFSTARSDTCREEAMAALLLPCAISPRISDSRGVSHDRSEVRRVERAFNELVHHQWIDHRPRLGHRVYGLGQLVGTGHPLLQQVGPAGRSGFEERQGIRRRRELAQDHHPDVGPVLPQPRRGLNALIRPGRAASGCR